MWAGSFCAAQCKAVFTARVDWEAMAIYLRLLQAVEAESLPAHAQPSPRQMVLAGLAVFAFQLHTYALVAEYVLFTET